MYAQDVINYLVVIIKKYPNIRFESSINGKLKIFGQERMGFDITLVEDVREITLYLSNFHRHFEKTENEIDELLNILYLSLTGNARIEETSKNGKPYKWTFQLKDDTGNWIDHEVTAFVNLITHNEQEIRWFQNEMGG